MTRVVEGESTSVGAGVAQFLRWRLTHWSDWRSPMLTLMGLAAVCRAPALVVHHRWLDLVGCAALAAMGTATFFAPLMAARAFQGRGGRHRDLSSEPWNR